MLETNIYCLLTQNHSYHAFILLATIEHVTEMKGKKLQKKELSKEMN
jgi:hypothetical protein